MSVLKVSSDNTIYMYQQYTSECLKFCLFIFNFALIST